jgi:hypothetical protein
MTWKDISSNLRTILRLTLVDFKEEGMICCVAVK